LRDYTKRIKLFLQINFNFFYRIYLKIIVNKKFKTEVSFFKGKNFNTTDKKSILFFTSHKCASTFFDKFFYLIKNCQDRLCINVDQFNTFILENKFNNSEKFLGKFKTKGYIFGPIRTFLKIPDIKKYDIILFLRDPRDVLVSDYFSMKFSHNIINKELILEKKQTHNKDINEFALWKANYYKKKYKSYLPLLELENVEYIRYNDFIENKQKVKNKLLKIFEIKNFTKELKELLNEKDILPPKENKIDLYRHKKMGQLNIFKSYLSDETIKYLNDEFREIIEKLNFN
jgi:hypothetical protein